MSATRPTAPTSPGARAGLSFAHMGLHCTDLARMEAFYTQVLGFTVTDRGPLNTDKGEIHLVFLSRDPDEHHQIVLGSGRPAEPHFNVINQISLKADSLATLQSMHSRMLQAVAASQASELLTVTHGNALSLYVRDPEGNRLELYIDLPWYVDQPHRQSVDLNQDPATLMAQAEEHARRQPGFQPRAQWRAAMARRMGLA